MTDWAVPEPYDSNRPVVCILGPTASGKTSLSTKVCAEFGGEVIVCDSIQLYEHCNILSAKVTDAEASGIPHHLLSSVSPLDPSFTVMKYQQAAVKAINDCHKRDKVPFIVGGTVYYAASTMAFDSLLGSNQEYIDAVDPAAGGYSVLQKKWDLPLDELEAVFKQTCTANRVPFEALGSRRAYREAMVCYEMTGNFPSRYQQKEESEASFASLVIYLTCDPEELSRRAQARVDEMKAQGVVSEAVGLYLKGISEGAMLDRGVFQAIGLKELKPLVDRILDDMTVEDSPRFHRDALDSMTDRELALLWGPTLPAQVHRLPDLTGLDDLIDDCLQTVVTSTVNYAKKQAKAVDVLKARGFPVVEVDTTRVRVDGWGDIVGQTAKIIRHFIAHPYKATLAPPDPEARKVFHCDICGRDIVGRQQYDVHLKSGKHKRGLRTMKRNQGRRPSFNIIVR
ncbi:tRNA delta(2)-isopentenylpyrophosphate transferase [Carpediemonas membranifera]|uniref:tRNA delta(2)-isopentenylpyrophosphate transferase n=1 Tax=Carpediemonas membranifera TaxID=201153 RepID=A0A8J6B5A7_9EUKA|nr:tRNA delta(2)-isopentenylpyrophosphate transferase [Carpediemonas membranifera]|eukprot:KAG9394594.1 tRNA delta(2)-isopentenylpyrophosphate transferase [Carpediemonas membranifera]